jgi:hypothetical protein
LRATTAATRYYSLYGLIQKTDPHLPQRDSNPRGSLDLYADALTAVPRGRCKKRKDRIHILHVKYQTIQKF